MDGLWTGFLLGSEACLSSWRRCVLCCLFGLVLLWGFGLIGLGSFFCLVGLGLVFINHLIRSKSKGGS